MDAQLPMIQPQSLQDAAYQSPSVFFRRYSSYLIGSFAALALALATIGLYGLISYTVQQRTREIGIRVALGAVSGDIFQMLLKDGLRATFLGIACGIIAGLGLTRLMASVLYGVKPSDWATFSGVALVLLIVAVVACAAPARRPCKWIRLSRSGTSKVRFSLFSTEGVRKLGNGQDGRLAEISVWI